ncbi:MAG TPA: type III pantothenate kinase, partial [Saprospiraceae bacterium]|nr:type III pantothenate kinase [Saprospiraceae bacterium]
MSLLTLDIGNTRTKAGLFRQGSLADRQVWAGLSPDQVLTYGRSQGVEAAMICSVAEPDGQLLERMRAAWPTWELTHETPLPFVNAYRTPQTLGKDRLAAAAGAQALWPGEACVVVDCGTCIKYEWVEADGTYRGGNIAPGLHMRIRAMHEFTARLPQVPMEMPDSPVGHSTETALQNGALRG